MAAVIDYAPPSVQAGVGGFGSASQLPLLLRATLSKPLDISVKRRYDCLVQVCRRSWTLRSRSTKPPKPDPVTSTPVRPAGSEFIDVRRVQAQAGELKLSDEIYDLPDEILIEWGHDIHSPGADPISYNTRTGEVTLWDAKTTSHAKSQKFKPSDTFAVNQSASNAIERRKMRWGVRQVNARAERPCSRFIGPSGCKDEDRWIGNFDKTGVHNAVESKMDHEFIPAEQVGFLRDSDLRRHRLVRIGDDRSLSGLELEVARCFRSQ